MMNELDWMVGLTFQSLTRYDHEWVVQFDLEARLTLACLWRFLDSGRIRVTSNDDGEIFGLPAPINTATFVSDRLSGNAINSVDLRLGALDLM